MSKKIKKLMNSSRINGTLLFVVIVLLMGAVVWWYAEYTTGEQGSAYPRELQIGVDEVIEEAPPPVIRLL